MCTICIDCIHNATESGHVSNACHWCCSITYNFNTDDESFEWYDLRNRNSKECSILKGKIDLLAKTAKQQPPAQPNGLSGAGSKPQRKPGILDFANAEEVCRLLK